MDSARTNKLVMFCDASKSAYGVASYCVTPNGECNLLYSKVKVAPLKSKTLPTLELLYLSRYEVPGVSLTSGISVYI